MKKVCPKCGKEFQCLHNENCFCMKYTLSEETQKQLKENYQDCLCEDCLKQFAENE